MRIKVNSSALIVAASGSILCADLTPLQRTFVSKIYEFEKILIEPLCDELANSLANSYVNEAIVDHVLRKSCGIPGLLSISAYTQQEYDVAFQVRMSNEWSKVVRGICKLETDKADSILLLVATYYGVQTCHARFNGIIEALLPIRCYMIYIDENSVPILYVAGERILAEELKNIFQRLLHVAPNNRPITDVESAVGNCMEFGILPFFNSLHILIKGVHPTVTDANTAELRLGSFETRWDMPETLNSDFYTYCHTKHVPLIVWLF